MPPPKRSRWIGRLWDVAPEVREKPSYMRSRREQARIQAADLPNARGWAFTTVTAVVTAGITTALLSVDAPTVLLAIAGGLSGVVLSYLAVLAVCWVQAPQQQLEELHHRIGDIEVVARQAQGLRHKVLLERRLNEVLSSWQQLCGQERDRGNLGDVSVEGETWFHNENKAMRHYLEIWGFPELIPQLVIEDANFKTWAEVEKAEVGIRNKISELLSGPFFDEVRALD